MNNELLEYLQKQKAEREAQVKDYLDAKKEIEEIDAKIAELTAKKAEIESNLGEGNEEILAEIAKIQGFIDGLIAPTEIEIPAEEKPVEDIPTEEPVQETIGEIAEEPAQEPVEAPQVFTPVN